MKPAGENKADTDRRLYETIRIEFNTPAQAAAWLRSNYAHLKRQYSGNTMKRYGTREDLFHQTLLNLLLDAPDK